VNVDVLAEKIAEAAKHLHKRGNGTTYYRYYSMYAYHAASINSAMGSWLVGFDMDATRCQVLRISESLKVFGVGVDEDIIAIAIAPFAAPRSKIILWQNKEHKDYDVFVADVML